MDSPIVNEEEAGQQGGQIQFKSSIFSDEMIRVSSVQLGVGGHQLVWAGLEHAAHSLQRVCRVSRTVYATTDQLGQCFDERSLFGQGRSF